MIVKNLRAFDRKEEVKINIPHVLNFLQQAWRSVSQQTIANCYHHAGFKIKDDTNQTDTPIDDEDPLDDLPLARLKGSASTMTEYVAVALSTMMFQPAKT